mgnify:CR=1 FL=1
MGPLLLVVLLLRVLVLLQQPHGGLGVVLAALFLERVVDRVHAVVGGGRQEVRRFLGAVFLLPGRDEPLVLGIVEIGVVVMHGDHADRRIADFVAEGLRREGHGEASIRRREALRLHEARDHLARPPDEGLLLEAGALVVVRADLGQLLQRRIAGAVVVDRQPEALDAQARKVLQGLYRAFDETDAVVLGTLCDQLGSAIKNARLYDEVNRAYMKMTELDKMKSEFFDRRAEIRKEVETMLDQIQESLKMKPSLTPLFTIRWEVA